MEKVKTTQGIQYAASPETFNRLWENTVAFGDRLNDGETIRFGDTVIHSYRAPCYGLLTYRGIPVCSEPPANDPCYGHEL